nr:VWA domain-containing protein [Nocardia bovistercoris]
MAAGVFAWFQFSDRASVRDNAAASKCVEGDSTLYVTVDPDIEAATREIADRYNASAPSVRDHCAKVTVTAKASNAMVAGFATGGAWDSTLGPQPALWIPASSRAIEAARVPGLIEGEPASVATSPVVLGVAEPLRKALEAAQTSWSDLPGLQQGSLNELGLSGWGGLRMAVPADDSTLAAATAVGATLSGADPLTAQAAGSGQVIAAVSGLAAAAPDVESAGAALDTIATAPQPAGATIHAVAATEQQLNAHMGVVAYRPTGSTPIADHPAATMSGPWVDQTQNLIAGVFADYLRTPESAAVFARAGFAPAAPAAAPGAARDALVKIAGTLAHPVLGVQSTVLLDVSASMSTTDGSGTRLSNSLGALRSTMNVMPPEFGLGVWTFGKNLDGTKPYKVLAATAPLTDNQRTAVQTALGTVRATETKTDQAYPTLVAAYKAAASDYAESRTNSILLVTDGPDDDSTVTGAKLLADIAAATDKARPVRVDVVVLSGAGTQTLQDLAKQTGGTYTKVDGTDNLAFAQAMVQALTTP